MAIELDLRELFEGIFKQVKYEKHNARAGVGVQTPDARKINWEKSQTGVRRSLLSPIPYTLYFETPKIELIIHTFEFRTGIPLEFKIELPKINWVFNFTPLLNLYPLEFKFEIPEVNWSFNYTFNYLLDLHIDHEWGLSEKNKAYYGKSKYGQSFYDPPNWNPEAFRKLIWDLRYKLTHYRRHDAKFTKETAKKWVEWVYDTLVKHGVAEHIAKSIAPTILEYEGKMLTSAYVGFALVGFARVMPKPSGKTFYYSKFSHRSPDDFYSTVTLDTITIVEARVGYSKVGYCRVAPSSKKIRTLKDRSKYRLIDKSIADKLKENIERGRKQFEPQEIANVRYQAYTISQIKHDTCEKKKWRGGKHQILLQSNLIKVKEILDRHGVVNFFRNAYYYFANEIAYRLYESKRKKKWKKVLPSDDAIIEKYIRMGCDENILREIANTIWRVIS